MSALQQPGRALVYRRIVVKVGTNLLTAGTARLDAETMASIARQAAAVRAAGGEVALVTSGAIAAGRHRLGGRDGAASDVHSRQVLAAVGQGRLHGLWDQLFEAHDVPVAQALLTRRDLADRPGYLNARNTLLALLELGAVPIINENDVVATEEIADSRIGDNDNLSAQVANLIDADLLLMLTDVDGLYSGHPATDPRAQLIAEVPQIDAAIESAAAGQPGQRGTGGMVTKLQAARIATAFGAHVIIARGTATDVIERAAAGAPVGTHFAPAADRVESRRRYLLSGLQERGHVVVDDGAARALRFDGKSLLPAGVVSVEGAFERGDVVRVLTTEGHHIATGTANYGSGDVSRIHGLRSDRIGPTLGYDYGEEIIHRSNLVLV